MFKATEGNILIVLIQEEDSSEISKDMPNKNDNNFFYQNLYDKDLIKNLSEKAKQPSVKILAKNLSVS